MNIFTRKKSLKVSRTVFCALLTFISSGVSADDIEIYEAIGNAQEAIGDGDFNPNILFVLDNSRSMDTFIATRLSVVQPTSDVFDRDIDYGVNGTGDELYLYDTNLNPLNVIISIEQNACREARDFFQTRPVEPVYRDRFTRWTLRNNNPDRYGWTNEVTSTLVNDRVIECEADQGVDGLVNGGPAFIHFDNPSGNMNASSTPLYQTFQQNFTGGALFPYGNDSFSAAWVLVSENYNAFLTQSPDSTRSVATGGQDEAQEACMDNGDRILIDDTGEIFECFTRLQTMKNALTLSVNGDPSNNNENGFDDVNIGLMRFNFNLGPNVNNFQMVSGGTIVDAVSDINEVDTNGLSNRDDFISKLDDLDFEGNTPLAESAYEAYLYFNGSNVNYSELDNSNDLTAAELNLFNLPSSFNDNLDRSGVVNAAANTLVYDSPIGTNECQDNFMVLLSDGAPTQDRDADSDILNLLNGTNSCGSDNNCLNEVSRALKENLNVNTFTIGFATGTSSTATATLEAAALAGAPDGATSTGFFPASNLSSLQTAFTQIISNVVDVDNDNFVAPAVSVSAFNRLESGTDIYYAVFAPEITPRWSGNIKKYNITPDSTIVDLDGDVAVDPVTGFFVDSDTDRARSFWSLTPDGAAVVEGGYAAELSTSRNIFASLDTSNTVTELTVNDDNDDQINPINSFYDEMFNLDSTGTMIGVDLSLTGVIGPVDNRTGSNRELNLENIIRFTLGESVEPGDITFTGQQRPTNNFVGESIHSTPVVISYGSTDEEPRDIVFLATNQGMLHAINGQGRGERNNADNDVNGEVGVVGGSERWSYIPDSSLLENLGGYFNNSLNSSVDHIYGLDGALSVDSTRDVDNNLTSAKIYMGQRRGGNKYFAIDVFNARSETDPVDKLWTIEGGTADFPRLADTWAEPVVTNFRSCDGAGACETIPALVLSGGYDGRPERYDDIDANIADLSDEQTGDTLGNAIYIVRADNGEVLWSTSNDRAGAVDTTIPHTIVEEMDHSIPSAPTVIDNLSADGAIDLIFAVDVSGQVFRYDFRNILIGNTTTEVRTGGRIANLQENNVNRYFYNPLDAVLLPQTIDENNVVTGLTRYALVTGSGYRAHPVQPEGFENGFYILHDENTTGPLLDANGDPVYDYVVTSVNAASQARRVIESTDVPELDIVDTTNPNSPTALQAATTHRNGFFVPLDAQGASKIINPTLIADSIVVGTSYDPDGVATSACSATPGQSSAFAINLLSGTVVEVNLNKAGVSGAPVIVYLLEEINGVEVLKPIVIIGTETFEGSTFGLDNIIVGKAIKKAWWETGRSSSN